MTKKQPEVPMRRLTTRVDDDGYAVLIVDGQDVPGEKLVTTSAGWLATMMIDCARNGAQAAARAAARSHTTAKTVSRDDAGRIIRITDGPVVNELILDADLLLGGQA